MFKKWVACLVWAAVLMFALAQSLACAAADFNGDGRSDYWWRNTDNGRNIVWLMSGADRQQAVLTNTVSNFAWQQVGLADFDGDGKTDVLWRNLNDGRNLLWFMNGGVRSSEIMLDSRPLTWSIGGLGDFDGDGRADILWRTEAGDNIIWFMNGGVRKSALKTYTVNNFDWQLAAVGDLNADGRSDLVWRNIEDGRNIAWFMGPAGRTSALLLHSVVDKSWELVGCDDFDADRADDLLWRHSDDGRNLLWFMGATGRKDYALLPSSSSSWDIQEVGDFDGDSYADIAWHTETNNNILWFMQGGMRIGAQITYAVANNAWMALRPAQENSSGGLWTCLLGVAEQTMVEAYAMTSETGEARLIYDGEFMIMNQVALNADEIWGDHVFYAPPGFVFTPEMVPNLEGDVLGKIDQRDSFSVVARFEGEVIATSVCDYDRQYEKDSSLQIISGNYISTVSDSPVDLKINTSGQISGQDTDGCRFEGSVQILSNYFNLYRLNIETTSCGVLDGTYHGLATLVEDEFGEELLGLSITGPNWTFVDVLGRY